MKCTKLLICDDHGLIRDALVHMAHEISTGIHTVEARNGMEALTMLEQQPDIDMVLLDVHLPDRNGLDLLDQMKAQYPKLVVVMLSSDETRTTIVDALERGAAGYICKSSPTTLLSEFLGHALNGNIALPSTILVGANGDPTQNIEQRQSPGGAVAGLSPRKSDVLNCLLRGMTNKQICLELGLAEGTVKTHVNAIFRVLNVNSRAQVVIEASRRKMPLANLSS